MRHRVEPDDVDWFITTGARGARGAAGMLAAVVVTIGLGVGLGILGAKPAAMGWAILALLLSMVAIGGYVWWSSKVARDAATIARLLEVGPPLGLRVEVRLIQTPYIETGDRCEVRIWTADSGPACLVFVDGDIEPATALTRRLFPSVQPTVTYAPLSRL